jgi:tetratricopeptide (TPR) repeat protein
MAIEGALQDVSLPDIIQLLAMGRKTGCLTLTDRSNFGYVYFRDGRVIYASVLNRPDRLGEILVRNGVITREQLALAMEQQARERGARLGELLVRVGALEETVLNRFIRIQIEEAVYHLFTWSQGSFHFDPDQTPDEEDLFLVNLPAENLLLEGARRVDEWSLIEKKIPSFDLVFSMTRDPADDTDVELTEHQRRVLPLLDGRRTVEDVVLESGLVEFDVGKALFGLIQAGFVERSGARPHSEPAADREVEQHLALGAAFYRSGMLEDAARECEAVLGRDPKNARALHRMGLIAFRSRRPTEALDYFGRIDGGGATRYAVHRNRALALEYMHRYGEALEALDRAAEARPGDPDTALARGIVLLQMGDVAGALESLHGYRSSPALRKPSQLYYAYTVLAAGMADQLDFAISVGREGLVQYPESAPILVNTAAVLERRDEGQAAAALYSRAVGRYPAPAQAHKALGDQAFERHELERARIHYERAVKVDPRLGDDVYSRLGTIASEDADLDVARLLWRRALELNPANEAVRARLEGLEREA